MLIVNLIVCTYLAPKMLLLLEKMLKNVVVIGENVENVDFIILI